MFILLLLGSPVHGYVFFLFFLVAFTFAFEDGMYACLLALYDGWMDEYENEVVFCCVYLLAC